jgi:hypothetical protein
VKPWSMTAIILYRLCTIQSDPLSRGPWQRLSSSSCTQFRGIREAMVHGSDYPLSLVHNSVIREAVGTDYPVSLLYNSEECVKPWFVGRDSSLTRVLAEPVPGALLSAGASPRYLF